VPEAIVGTAFFPGGYDLWNPAGTLPLPKFPVGKIMVLGHDFHSEAGYEESRARGSERLSQPTWKNLIDVLTRASIGLEECFFTNVYMGLRKGDKTTGPFPGATDDRFVQHCRTLLLKQIATQRPSLIITLGVNAPVMLASLSNDLPSRRIGLGLKYLNDSNAVVSKVTFLDLPNFLTTTVALIHPCLRGPNLRHRRYRGLEGDEAEILMLEDARGIARTSKDWELGKQTNW